MTAPDPADVPPAPRSDVLCAAWASPADVPERHRALISDEEWLKALMIASEVLFYLSGRRFYGGGCSETVDLRSSPPRPGEGTWPYDKTWGRCACWDYGTWMDGWLYPPRGDYLGSHYSPMAIRLPRSPVTGITAVTVGGSPLVSTAYRLTGSGYLERIDGSPWSVCNDSTSVTYTFGAPPPEGGAAAAVELAVQIAMSWSGSGECQLPERVQSVTRQGVSMVMLDSQEFLEKGRTGLYAVDLWLSAVNPSARPQRGRVWSPDIPTGVRR